MLFIAMSVSMLGYIPSASQVKSRPRGGTTKVSSLALNANESLKYVLRFFRSLDYFDSIMAVDYRTLRFLQSLDIQLSLVGVAHVEFQI